MTENQKLREALQAISHIDDTTNHSVDASAALDRIGQIARQALALPTKAEPAAQEAAPKPNLIESDDPFAELITASPQPPPALRARPWSAGGEDWVRWSDYCVMMGLRDSALSAQAVPDERDKVALSIATDALDEIALAGMSGTGQESEEAMRDWHARQAWKFIGIAARAKSAIDAAIAAHAAAKGE